MTVVANADVIIVAHNAGELLVPAVASAVHEVGADRVWVIDAESSDASVAGAVESMPGIHVLPVPNAGFSASNNRGIERTSDEWVVLLNPDAELHEGAVSAMIEAALSDDRIGVVGPLVLQPDGSVQPESFGRFPTLARRMGLAWSRLVGALFGSGGGVAGPSARSDVDWVTGACMLVRRAAIHEAGPLDEGFFLYYEDVEWCHRMKDHGWRVVIEPGASCVHHLGRSAAPSQRVARAYRESFYRYCDLYGLWGLKAAGMLAVTVRRALGGPE